MHPEEESMEPQDESAQKARILTELSATIGSQIGRPVSVPERSGLGFMIDQQYTRGADASTFLREELGVSAIDSPAAASFKIHDRIHTAASSAIDQRLQGVTDPEQKKPLERAQRALNLTHKLAVESHSQGKVSTLGSVPQNLVPLWAQRVMPV